MQDAWILLLPLTPAQQPNEAAQAVAAAQSAAPKKQSVMPPKRLVRKGASRTGGLARLDPVRAKASPTGRSPGANTRAVWQGSGVIVTLDRFS